MATKLTSILLVVLCTLLTSAGMVLWKFAANQGIPNIFFTWYLWLGFLSYAFGAAILIKSFQGGEVSVLFPIIATSYIWVTLLSNYFFQEAITLFKWTGIFGIVVGITMLGLGSNKVKH